MKILITGGAGFIGSNFIRYMCRNYPHYHLINLDLLTYASNPSSLREVESLPNYRFVHGDIRDQTLVDRILSEGVDAVINFAAETHVDRSVSSSYLFVSVNVLGTQVLLEESRKHCVKRFIQISTDEVYGDLGEGLPAIEENTLAPSNPYAASKAGADLLVRAYHQTYGLPINITRCSNNFGPCQFPEKFIPLMVTKALTGQKLPIYGDGLNVRDWLYVEDHCTALDLVLHKGSPGEVYNIGSTNEWTNLAMAQKILALLHRPESLIRHVSDRLGHDRRYAIKATKLQKDLGWSPRHDFYGSLEATIQWYVENRSWWEPIID